MTPPSGKIVKLTLTQGRFSLTNYAKTVWNGQNVSTDYWYNVRVGLSNANIFSARGVSMPVKNRFSWRTAINSLSLFWSVSPLPHRLVPMSCYNYPRGSGLTRRRLLWVKVMNWNTEINNRCQRLLPALLTIQEEFVSWSAWFNDTRCGHVV